jgi:hypothetical protein
VTTFQPDFYDTCATVIPVLFLAVAVQGTSYRDLLRMLVKASGARWNGPPLRVFWAYTATALAWIVGFLLVAVGLVGEIAALYTLYLDREDGARGLVLAATLALLVTAVLGPLRVAVLAVNLSTWPSVYPSPAEYPSPGYKSVGDEQADIPDDDGTDPPETGGSTV